VVRLLHSVGKFGAPSLNSVICLRNRAACSRPETLGASTNVTYRTLRCGRWLQIWMVEGRDYRSPNRAPDGPEKTIWGAEQNAWLKGTLLASDAAFKILITPTPMVGPDDASKRDNHTNPRAFRHEGEEFLAWAKAQHIRNFYTTTGDRHWHFHSIHPTGHEEFACGALNSENARLGVSPGTPQSSDPKGKVRQLCTDAQPAGGYILVEVLPAPDGASARLHFSMQDEWGEVLYEQTR
jgi:alkaline phosphatase D